MDILPKHLKYRDSYIPNDYYWGLGIEHETYLFGDEYKIWSLNDMLTKTKCERYSVDYFMNYKMGMYKNAMLDIYNDTMKFKVPILWNSYYLEKCDIFGSHKTTYSKVPGPNPSFSGKTIWNQLCDIDPWLKEHYEKEFIFDGDTVELTTLKFYKTSVPKMLEEYKQIQKDLITHLRKLDILSKIRLMPNNNPFATYTSNMSNISMFNNGTLHINITLPTMLNEVGSIQDMELFTEQHRRFARAIQWFEPLWAAIYGAADILSESEKFGSLFTRASQRCAVSRYIGIGTFDTNTMNRGKVLQIDGNKKYSWIPSQHDDSAYSFQDKIGLDLNFNKHYHHGLELRWFDQIPITGMREVLRTLIAIADFSLNVESIVNPTESKVWVRITKDILLSGKNYIMPEEAVLLWSSIFNVHNEKRSMKVFEMYESLAKVLCERYKDGECYRCFYDKKTEEPKINIDKQEKTACCQIV